MKAFYLVLFFFWSLSLFGQELFDTSKRFSDGRNNYRPERVVLHQEIINKYLGMFLKKPKRKVPVAVFMAGGPGSGKSTGMRALDKAGILILKKYVIIDSDAIKEFIPEYADFKKISIKRAASVGHRESSYLKDRIFGLGINQRINLILDGTLSNYRKYEGVIRSIKPRGYSNPIIYVKASLPELIKRVDLRAERTGRMVPHSFVKKSVKSIEESVSGLEKVVRATFHINNDRKAIIEKVVFPTGKTKTYNLNLDKVSKKKSQELRKILEGR